MVVTYKPIALGKTPVRATPKPNKSIEIYTNLWALIINKTYISVNAKSPGISLKLWSIPIFSPSNNATSTTKLLSRLIHAENENIIDIDIIYKSAILDENSLLNT